MTEFRAEHLAEVFFYVSSTFLHLSEPVFQALDPSLLAPKCSRTIQFQRDLTVQRISRLLLLHLSHDAHEIRKGGPNLASAHIGEHRGALRGSTV